MPGAKRKRGITTEIHVVFTRQNHEEVIVLKWYNIKNIVNTIKLYT